MILLCYLLLEYQFHFCVCFCSDDDDEDDEAELQKELARSVHTAECNWKVELAWSLAQIEEREGRGAVKEGSQGAGRSSRLDERRRFVPRLLPLLHLTDFAMIAMSRRSVGGQSAAESDGVWCQAEMGRRWYAFAASLCANFDADSFALELWAAADFSIAAEFAQLCSRISRAISGRTRSASSTTQFAQISTGLFLLCSFSMLI